MVATPSIELFVIALQEISERSNGKWITQIKDVKTVNIVQVGPSPKSRSVANLN
jgi:hypothetical protein